MIFAGSAGKNIAEVFTKLGINFTLQKLCAQDILSKQFYDG